MRSLIVVTLAAFQALVQGVPASGAELCKDIRKAWQSEMEFKSEALTRLHLARNCEGDQEEVNCALPLQQRKEDYLVYGEGFDAPRFQAVAEAVNTAFFRASGVVSEATGLDPHFAARQEDFSMSRQIEFVIFAPDEVDGNGREPIDRILYGSGLRQTPDRDAKFNDFLKSENVCGFYSAVTSQYEIIHSQIWVKAPSPAELVAPCVEVAVFSSFGVFGGIIDSDLDARSSLEERLGVLLRLLYSGPFEAGQPVVNTDRQLGELVASCDATGSGFQK